MTQELAEQIASLVLDTDPSAIDSVLLSFYSFPFDRYTKAADVFASISVFEEEDIKAQIMIMKNGDVHARTCPYYDGDREGMLMIHNQAKLQQLLAPLINPILKEINYKQVHDEIKEALRKRPIGLKHLPYNLQEVVLPPGYESILRAHYLQNLGTHAPEALTYRGALVRTDPDANCVIAQAINPAMNAYYKTLG